MDDEPDFSLPSSTHVGAEPGPLQDVALALDSFSQAAMEARYVLDGRQGS